MNIQLNELCMKNDIDFLEIVIDKDTMVDRRGLHLNFTGQDKVARSIFKQCEYFKLERPIGGIINRPKWG